jgi:6-phospho-3-hexuloisomerase
MTQSLTEMNALASAEIARVVKGIKTDEVEALIDVLLNANRIATHGVGREGLMMKAICMRLFHLGLDAHVVGDMTVPHLGEGDLLLVSAGPGYFSTVDGLIITAQKAGAKVACLTAQPEGGCPQRSDTVLVLPAQTMASDEDAPTSFLPMGSLYEAVQFLFAEYLVLMLRERLQTTPESMRERHTNLE